jgi:hypothetical protein
VPVDDRGSRFLEGELIRAAGEAGQNHQKKDFPHNLHRPDANSV